MELENYSIHAFLDKYQIKTDTGIPLDFKNHAFMWDIYSDLSPKQVGMKAAQVTWSTCAILKSFWVAKYLQRDLIYTLPTESDRNTFVGGKVNRIIAQNPILQQWVKDKDSIEQKQVDDNFIHFKGTWTQKAAIMLPSDLNIYDEVDSSKQDVIEMYSTRLQHSRYKWEWYFSHPSASGYGVDRYWAKSDQKHWYIKCPHCNERQYLSWPESIENEMFVCKVCKKELSDDVRRKGEWVAKYKDREFSGYWIPLLICPWVSAKDILKYEREKTEEYFYNKVLGLPYVGGGNKLTWELFAQNLTGKKKVPAKDGQAVLGIDTGLKIDFVMGDSAGLFYHGEAKDYDELDQLMETWPRMIAVVDAGGDLIGSRKFYEKWTGRVFLCYTGGDRKTKELLKWGRGDEYGNVVADRNRMIQLVVDEFRNGRIPVHGSEGDWLDYWNDWNNLTRVKQVDPVTQEPKGYKWVRSGRDHRAMSTIYWRVGMDKYGFGGAEIMGDNIAREIRVASPIYPDGTMEAITPSGEDLVEATLEKLRDGDDDWRNL